MELSGIGVIFLIFLVVLVVICVINFKFLVALSVDHENVIDHLKSLKYIFTQLKNIIEEFIEDTSTLRTDVEKFEKDKSEIQETKLQLERESSSLQLAKQELNSHRSKFEDSKKKFEDESKKLQLERKEFEASKEEFEKAREEFEQAKEEFESSKKAFYEEKSSSVELQEYDTMINPVETSEFAGDSKDALIDSSGRYYLVCLCTRSNQSKFIKSFTTSEVVEGDLSEADLNNIKNNIVASNENYIDCEIIYFNRIKG